MSAENLFYTCYETIPINQIFYQQNEKWPILIN